MTTLNTDTVEFTLQNTLKGHSRPINLLAISPDQSRLISVGDDARIIVWSIASGERLFVVERPFNGPATAAAWASRDSSRFVVGFASGDILLFTSEKENQYCDSKPASAGKGAIADIVYDANYDRVASISDESTQLWKIKWPELVPILQSPFLSEGYGRCIQFHDHGASIVMYYLDSHECICYAIDPWEKRWSTRLNTRIGYAAPNHDGKYLLVSNLKDGIDEYQFPSLEKVQTFSFPIERNYILHIRTLPAWNLVVVGGDNGFARVFNRINGQLVSEIHHGVRGQLIQVVEAFVDSGDRFVVVTASSGTAPFDLKVWVFEPPKAPVFSKKSLDSPGGTVAPFSTWWDRITIAFLTFLYMLLLIFLIITALYFVVGDIGDVGIPFRLQRRG